MGTADNIDTAQENSAKDTAATPDILPPPPTHMHTGTISTAKKTSCSFCGEDFPSRSALFRHLQRQAEGCPAPRLDPGEKAMLLFGYDCCSKGTIDHAEPAAASGISSRADIVAGGDSAGERVLQAMGISGFEERTAGVNGEGAKPVGFSQASSVGSRRCPLLAQEAGVSATADTLCLKAPTTIPKARTREWLDETNATLAGSGVKLLGRMPVPRDLHAEAHATRRRYEYLLPAWLLDESAEGPWAGPARGERDLIPLLKGVRGLSFKPFGSCNVRVDGKRRRRCPLWHNFSAESLPHSPSAARRLYRFFSHSMVVIDEVDYVCLSVSGDAFVDRQVRGMVALAIAAARGLVSGEEIVACIDPKRQEDMFPVPLAPLSPCWLAEVGYSTWQTKLGGICMSPGAAKRLAYPLEGWSDEATRSAGAAFRRSVQESAAGWWRSQLNVGADWLRSVLEPGAAKLRAELSAANKRAVGAIAASADDDRRKLSESEKQSLSGAPTLFSEVVRLLREADASGLWPASTPARDSVISGGAVRKKAPSAKSYSRHEEKKSKAESGSEGQGEDGEGNESDDGDDDAWSEVPEEDDRESVSRGKDQEGTNGARDDVYDEGQDDEQQMAQKPAPHGGSFTVGAFPPPCPPPRGNTLFPELMRAAFELESVLLPDRPPSSTIAVNRHAKFRPHIDSGTGAGQSLSLIVGLGDYVGGELVVEGEEVDVRYKPREFNGWTQRHWTRPFKGERFSLVWFTPKGCEGVANGAGFVCPGSVHESGGGNGNCVP